MYETYQWRCQPLRLTWPHSLWSGHLPSCHHEKDPWQCSPLISPAQCHITPHPQIIIFILPSSQNWTPVCQVCRSGWQCRPSSRHTHSVSRSRPWLHHSHQRSGPRGLSELHWSQSLSSAPQCAQWWWAGWWWSCDISGCLLLPLEAEITLVNFLSGKNSKIQDWCQKRWE